MTTWGELLRAAIKGNNDPCETLTCTIPQEEITRRFDAGFGSTEGTPFYAWSADFVYFCVEYDGAEWVSSVPRNPTDCEAHHIGG